MNGDPLQRLEPPQSQTAEPFWEATRQQRLLLQHCPTCDHAIWFPRTLCPRCANTDLEWRESTGHGVVYAVSVQYQAPTPQMRDRVPYAVVLVDLTEGVRLMSSVIGCDPEKVTVGMRVEAAWEPLSDGRHLLMFEPDQGERT